VSHVRIGLLGGTGDMGRGLAIRWVIRHNVLIGSRMPEKAERRAEELNNLARGFYKGARAHH
jgi:predicted dinucleotide-binding enzyme